MNIACVIDNRFVPYCGIMLTSLFENNKKEQFNVYILSGGLSKTAQKKLLDIASSYAAIMKFCYFDETLLKDCVLTDNTYISLATYYKLLIAKILPQEIDKVLYLDCDIVVRGSISELYNLNIKDYPLAAVDETLYGDHTTDFLRLSYNPIYKYFNAGVLLINLKYWRKHELTNCFLEYVRKYPERIKYHDQDVFNAVLCGKWLAMEYKWNVMSFAYQYRFISTYKTTISDTSFVNNPKILHYTCTPKPWHIGCFHPMRGEYTKYKKMTIWKNAYSPFQGLSFKQAIRCIVYALYMKKSGYIKIS